MSDRLRPAERDTFWCAPHKRPEAELLRLLREVLADPSPYETAEQFTRYNNDDLAHLDLDELDRERLRLRVGWAFVGLSAWGAQRLAVLDREAERRRRRQRR